MFLEGDNRGKFTVPLSPVVSDPIYDKKAMSDLVICKLSDCSCTVAGGKEIILLCEKVKHQNPSPFMKILIIVLEFVSIKYYLPKLQQATKQNINLFV